MKKSLSILATLLVFASAGEKAIAGDDWSISLAGKWRFQLDRDDVGIAERWFAGPLPDRIRLPGGLTEQGIGDPISTTTPWIGGIVDQSWFTAPEYAPYREPGNVKIPFWLQPELYYAGAAWFQRDIDVPDDWANRRVVLFLERAHWETQVWVDDRLIGTGNALATPHEYDLGLLSPGRHTLTVRVDNRMIVDIGENSHSISDHTQGNWNGLVGRLELRATPVVWIEDVQVFPHAAQRTATVRVTLGNATEKPGQGRLTLLVKHTEAGAVRAGVDSDLDREIRLPVTWEADGTTIEFTLRLGEAAPLWDEFNPALFALGVALQSELGDHLPAPVTFGLRDVATDGTQFTINGRPVFFRGTLECAIFPKTGHPPTDLAGWRKVIRAAKAHGLNMLRFHSWCPPEAAFRAADELGFYLHVECSSWANQSTTLGDGKPVDAWLYAEADRILKAYGNHPSFVLLLYGNEPGGARHKAWLAEWVDHYRARDPRHLVSGGAGWPQQPEDQFHVTPDPRVQGWGQGLNSRINGRPPETTTDYRDYIQRRNVPVISHEIGQWCVYPNFEETSKYTGYLKARNFELFYDRLVGSRLGSLSRDFLIASGKLQALCYKEDIESALRTPGMGGFQLLDLHDFPGQGTALVGVLDPFWEEKGYIKPAEYRRFCNATVPLARLPKRVFTTAETLEAEIEIAHFGPVPIADAVVEWSLRDGRGRVFRSVSLPPRTVPVGNGTAVCRISVDLEDFPAPAKGRLGVRLVGTDFENDWDVWIYPAQPEPVATENVWVTAEFDDAAQARLAKGGRVLLTLPAKKVRNFETAPVKLGFSSIFWNTAWTGRQAPTTLGILCDPKHRALAGFPTDFHSNWQWWYLIHRAGALRLDLLPLDTEPVVRVIDDWVTARPLGLIVEGRVGEGGIVICGFDLTHEADDPVSRQMRASLVDYLGSAKFKPRARFTVGQVKDLIALPKPGALNDVRRIKADSEQPGFEAANAVDGDPTTLWHTAWGEGAPGFPHALTIEFTRPQRVVGVTLLPRQDGNRNGWIKECVVRGWSGGNEPPHVLAEVELVADDTRKTIHFPTPVTLGGLELDALSGHANGPWASLAEITLLPAADQ